MTTKEPAAEVHCRGKKIKLNGLRPLSIAEHERLDGLLGEMEKLIFDPENKGGMKDE